MRLLLLLLLLLLLHGVEEAEAKGDKMVEDGLRLSCLFRRLGIEVRLSAGLSSRGEEGPFPLVNLVSAKPFWLINLPRYVSVDDLDHRYRWTEGGKV
jgi:hypothetical protein